MGLPYELSSSSVSFKDLFFQPSFLKGHLRHFFLLSLRSSFRAFLVSGRFKGFPLLPPQTLYVNSFPHPYPLTLFFLDFFFLPLSFFLMGCVQYLFFPEPTFENRTAPPPSKKCLPLSTPPVSQSFCCRIYSLPQHGFLLEISIFMVFFFRMDRQPSPTSTKALFPCSFSPPFLSTSPPP